MNERIFNPNNISNLSAEDLIEFYYQTDKASYQPFLELSQNNKSQTDSKVDVITLSDYCELNCVYCSFRKENNNQFILSLDKLKQKLHKVLEQDIKEVIIESGVNPDIFSGLSKIKELQKEFPELIIYLDIGSETFLSNLNLLNDFPVFLDYSPLNKDFRDEIQCFDKKDQLYQFLKNNNRLYANFIVDIPGQDFSDLVQDLLFLTNWKELQGIKICPFLPQDNTGYSIFGEACFLTTLKTISISRLLRPDWDIFISPEIHKLSYDDTMKKALLYGGNKELIVEALDAIV